MIFAMTTFGYFFAGSGLTGLGFCLASRRQNPAEPALTSAALLLLGVAMLLAVSS